MDKRIVGHALCQHFTAIESLVVKTVKADSVYGSAQASHQCREPGKQFQVDDGVNAFLASPDQESQGIDRQSNQARFIDRKDVFFRHRVQ